MTCPIHGYCLRWLNVSRLYQVYLTFPYPWLLFCCWQTPASSVAPLSTQYMLRRQTWNRQMKSLNQPCSVEYCSVPQGNMNKTSLITHDIHHKTLPNLLRRSYWGSASIRWPERNIYNTQNVLRRVRFRHRDASINYNKIVFDKGSGHNDHSRWIHQGASASENGDKWAAPNMPVQNNLFPKGDFGVTYYQIRFILTLSDWSKLEQSMKNRSGSKLPQAPNRKHWLFVTIAKFEYLTEHQHVAKIKVSSLTEYDYYF